MRLAEFWLLTDENVDPEIVAFLRNQGFVVLDVMELGWQGVPDVEVLRRATIEGRVVVTHDPDFGTLAILQNEPLIGIVYLRPGHISSQFTIETIQAILDADPALAPPFVLVAKRTGNRVTIRVRKIGP